DRHARDRSLRARVLEGVPPPHGLLMLERVVRLNADYARAIDDDRLEDWPDFFTEKCLYKITSADNHRRGLEAGVIYADTKSMLRDRVAALREANIYERQTYRHLIGLPALVGTEGELTRAETPFLVVRIMRDGTMDLFATGLYLDALMDDACARHLRDRIVGGDSGEKRVRVVGWRLAAGRRLATTLHDGQGIAPPAAGPGGRRRRPCALPR